MNTELDQAPVHIKLAVDLIMILEQHDVGPQQVLDALTIVQHDYQQKLAAHHESER
ncbi:DUF2496 domain-containing protein [Pseudoalteromonas mariniglutinosa]|uniref:DUF2496 domain-containing protein n=1 Tax=Pseudoalteromonas mariniglutinosa TaxID=206042 RepID=UPI00384FB6CA